MLRSKQKSLFDLLVLYKSRLIFSPAGKERTGLTKIFSAVTLPRGRRRETRMSEVAPAEFTPGEVTKTNGGER
jgi:hypothetical protein